METVYLLTEMDVYEGNTKVGTKTLTLIPQEQEKYYYFTLDGLTAVQMNDRVRSVLYGTRKGQEYYSPVDDYSIGDYAYSQLTKAGSSEELKNLCAELLRYGGAAQSYKGYRTDAPADGAMTEEQRARLADPETVAFGNTNAVLEDLAQPSVTWVGKALDLNSKVVLKFVFDLGDAQVPVSQLYLKVTYRDYLGQEKVGIVTGPEAYGNREGRYVFSFDGLMAAELRRGLTLQICYEGQPVSQTLQYSADTYGQGKTGLLGELCKALFAYSDSARAFFGQ